MLSVKKRLIDIIGEDRVVDEEKILLEYSKDQSFSPKRKPDFVVFAETV